MSSHHFSAFLPWLLVVSMVVQERTVVSDIAIDDPILASEKALDLDALEKLLLAREESGQPFTTELARLTAFGEALVHDQDYARAFTVYRMVAVEGHSQAQSDLAYLYLNGLGTAPSIDEARRWYERSAAQDNPWGLFGLARLLEKSDNPSDRQRAQELLAKSATLGLDAARRRLGMCNLEYTYRPAVTSKTSLHVRFAEMIEPWQWEVVSDSCSPNELDKPPLLIAIDGQSPSPAGIAPAVVPIPSGEAPIRLLIQHSVMRSHTWRLSLENNPSSGPIIIFPMAYASCQDGLVAKFIPDPVRPELQLALVSRSCRCGGGEGELGFPALEFDEYRVDVVVSSSPSGATIFIGGRNLGATPQKLSLSSLNEYVPIVLKKAGYLDDVLIVRIPETSPDTLYVNASEQHRLPRRSGSISLRTRTLRKSN